MSNVKTPIGRIAVVPQVEEIIDLEECVSEEKLELDTRPKKFAVGYTGYPGKGQMAPEEP